MGGGGQANSGQASTAAAQQTAANNQDMALSAQNAAYQKQLFQRLFGGQGQNGTLNAMLDPSSLTQTGFNPAYKSQWNLSQDQIAKNYQNQRGSLAQSFANAGATSRSTPNGFQADQMNQLARGEADTRGSTFAGLMGNQYKDTLNNFWNASNIASGNAASAGSGALQGSGQSGTSSAQVYGTAGAYHPSQGLQVAGQVGAAAMCPAKGSRILMADGTWQKVEEIKKGQFVRSIDGFTDEVTDDPVPSKPQDCVFVKAGDHLATVSFSHTFALPKGGYSFAAKCGGGMVLTMSGEHRVSEVARTDVPLVCWHLFLSRSHTYCIDGIWSLE